MESYYQSYYSTRKHLYKIRYETLKVERRAELELYKPYGGSAAYYKDALIKTGLIVIKLKN